MSGLLEGSRLAGVQIEMGPPSWATRMRWPNPHPSMAPSSFSGGYTGRNIGHPVTFDLASNDPAVSPPGLSGKGTAESGYPLWQLWGYKPHFPPLNRNNMASLTGYLLPAASYGGHSLYQALCPVTWFLSGRGSLPSSATF